MLTLDDLRRRARRRIPHFIWEYLDSGTGSEAATRRNRAAFDDILLMPSVLDGEVTPDLTTTLMGRDYALPFGVAPVGQSGLIWPGAETLLAQAATRAGMPFTLSTVATETPETVGPHTDGRGWFQLYPPRDPEILADLLNRAKTSGFDTLVMTVDVPVASRRERQIKGGLVQPPRITPRILAQVALCPVWALGRARLGMPRMKTLDAYSNDNTPRDPTQHVGYLLRTAPDWDYVKRLRDGWDGKFIVKGVLQPDTAERLSAAGVDAIWVSNHAGRQFDAVPASITALPALRAATQLPLIFDSGIGGGLDILRAYALGADYVMLGRAWHYALGALGPKGPDHLIDMLRRDIIANIGQMGLSHPREARHANNFANVLKNPA